MTDVSRRELTAPSASPRAWRLPPWPCRAGSTSMRHSRRRPAPRRPRMTPDEALARLLAGNRRFANDKVRSPRRNTVRRAEIAQGQNPFATLGELRRLPRDARAHLRPGPRRPVRRAGGRQHRGRPARDRERRVRGRRAQHAAHHGVGPRGVRRGHGGDRHRRPTAPSTRETFPRWSRRSFPRCSRRSRRPRPSSSRRRPRRTRRTRRSCSTAVPLLADRIERRRVEDRRRHLRAAQRQGRPAAVARALTSSRAGLPSNSGSARSARRRARCLRRGRRRTGGTCSAA